jgi:hypothetical protein
LRLVATEYQSIDGSFHEPDQGSRPFFNEEAMQFKWAELQTSDAKLNRMADGGFKLRVAAGPAGLEKCLEERFCHC